MLSSSTLSYSIQYLNDNNDKNLFSSTLSRMIQYQKLNKMLSHSLLILVYIIQHFKFTFFIYYVSQHLYDVVTKQLPEDAMDQVYGSQLWT